MASEHLTSFLIPRQATLYVSDGVVPIPNGNVYPQEVSKIWNVTSDGLLEASLYGPFSLTVLHPVVKQVNVLISTISKMNLNHGDVQYLISIQTVVPVTTGRSWRTSRLQKSISILRVPQSAL